MRAGVEIADHELSAGGRATGTAGVKGYVDATPVIGYRETAQPGEDKKGDFFIRGDMEIAAQPFLGLSGSLFIELDSPWWSPAPDKTWTWPMGSKEWPLGQTLGIAASVDYVLGSGTWPQIDFKPPEFSADKFLSDLVDKRTQEKSGRPKDKGKWNEKNSKKAERPAIADAGPPNKPPLTVKDSSAKSKKTGTPIARGDRTADGKSIRALKAKARKEGKADKSPSKKPKDADARKREKKEEHDRKLAKGLAALDAVTRRYAENGALKDEVVGGVKSVRRKFKVFKSIDVIDAGERWDYSYVASKGKHKGPKKAKPGANEWPRGDRGDPIPIKWYKHEGIYPTIGGNSPTQGVTLPRTARKDSRKLRVSGGNFVPAGKVLKRRAVGRPPEPKKEDIKRRLDLERDKKKNGLKVSHKEYAIDHVRDLSWFGRDVYTNLWPLDPKVNNAVNASHNQYARAMRGNAVETHSVKTWGTSKHFWIAKVIGPPSTSGGHGTSRKRPGNDGTELPKRKP